MSSSVGIKEVAIPLSANQMLDLAYYGNSFLITELTGTVQFAPNDQEWSVAGVGHGFNGFPFNKIRFRETAGAAASVKFLYGVGDVDFRQLLLEGSVANKGGDTLGTPAVVTAGTAATLAVAEDTDRNRITIQNLDAAENVWIGDANVGNDASPRGLKLLPGAAWSEETGAAVYVRRGGASDVEVGILEVST